ncbi:MAG TPA: hypothetical protein VHM66_10770 [Solirubrobacterales bacterium]|jgi:hypothetical protein|nr:hypothetical protein [Solirubrobacterales bacterium]
MERTMWTDERLDERFNGIDRRFDAVDKRFDDLERRMEAGFDRVDRDIRDLQILMFQPWGSTMVAILGTLATNG